MLALDFFFHTTELPNIVDKHCNYTKDIKKIDDKLEDLEHISYEKKAELIKKKDMELKFPDNVK